MIQVPLHLEANLVALWVLALAGCLWNFLRICTCLAAVLLPIRYHTDASWIIAFFRRSHELSS